MVSSQKSLASLAYASVVFAAYDRYDGKLENEKETHDDRRPTCDGAKMLDPRSDTCTCSAKLGFLNDSTTQTTKRLEYVFHNRIRRYTIEDGRIPG